jgi:hypothetical protein
MHGPQVPQPKSVLRAMIQQRMEIVARILHGEVLKNGTTLQNHLLMTTLTIQQLFQI